MADMDLLLKEARRLSAAAETTARNPGREAREAQDLILSSNRAGGGGRSNSPSIPARLLGNVGRAVNEPYAALEMLANLTNVKRARSEGYRANVEGAREAYSRHRSEPWRDAPSQYLEEINFPYPKAGGFTLGALEPGPDIGPLMGVLGAGAGFGRRALRKITGGTDILEAFNDRFTRLSRLADSDPDVMRAARQLEMFDTAVGEGANLRMNISEDSADEVLGIVYSELGPAKGNWFLETLGLEPAFTPDYVPKGSAWMVDWDMIGMDEAEGALESLVRPNARKLENVNRWLRTQGIDPDNAF